MMLYAKPGFCSTSARIPPGKRANTSLIIWLSIGPCKDGKFVAEN